MILLKNIKLLSENSDNLKLIKKTLFNSVYPAYVYEYKNIKFLIYKTMTGYRKSTVPKWYMKFYDSYFITEKEESEEYSGKKQIIDMAKYYIDRHISKKIK